MTALTTDLQRLHDAARAMDAGRWHERLLASAASAAASAAADSADGLALPGFPPEEVQRGTNGHPAEQTMRQAFRLYGHATQAYAEHGNVRPEARFLDFGTGWGRIWRYFLRDFSPDRMAAFDVNPKMADFWAASMLGAPVDIASPFEPLPYGDDTFDLVVSNSVFSHLSEPLNLHSARELHRVMRPGGIFVGTTFGRTHLRLWKSWAEKPEGLGARQRMLAGLTEDFDRTIADYERGEFIFLATDRARLSDYEITAFSGDWLRKNWADWFEVLEYTDDKMMQSLFVCRAKPAWSAAAG